MFFSPKRQKKNIFSTKKLEKHLFSRMGLDFLQFNSQRSENNFETLWKFSIQFILIFFKVTTLAKNNTIWPITSKTTILYLGKFLPLFLTLVLAPQNGLKQFSSCSISYLFMNYSSIQQLLLSQYINTIYAEVAVIFNRSNNDMIE